MKKVKWAVLYSMFVILTFSLVACGNKKADNNKLDTKVVNSLKGEVTIPKEPQRIVDISGSSEELLIVGYKPLGTANVDSYDTSKFPSYITEKLKDSKIVGHSMMDTMDIEAIVECNPDLIIMSERQEKIYDQLKDIAPTVMMKDYGNSWREKLKDVSVLFDKEKISSEWIENYDKKAKELGENIKSIKGEKTYLPVLYSMGSFMVFTDSGIGTVINDDMKLKRPNNMPKQDGITLPSVSMEGLTDIDADNIIVIANESDKKDLKDNSVWREMRAVKEGNVTILDAIPYFTQVYNPMGKELLLESIKNELIK